MDPSEARDHLDLVDRILTQSDRSLGVIGDIFVVWGVVAACIDVAFQLTLAGQLPAGWGWIPAPLIAVAVAYTIFRATQFKNASDRMTTAGREYLNVLWIVFGLTAIAQTGAYHLFPAWSGSALWTLAAAIVTFFIGMHGNRAAILGGCVLLASLIVASYVPTSCGWILGGGMLLGYAGFGVAAMLAKT